MLKVNECSRPPGSFKERIPLAVEERKNTELAVERMTEAWLEEGNYIDGLDVIIIYYTIWAAILVFDGMLDE